MPSRAIYLKASFLAFFVSSASALSTIETTKKNILTLLQAAQSECLSEFTLFSQRYDEVVTCFFDRNNRDSLQTHVTYMEKELKTLESVYNDKRYELVRHLLAEYRTALTELVTTLKKYIGSRNTVGLALHVSKYRPLLPSAIRERGDVSLFQALRHRLRCG